jgi:hypothetical protein
MRTFLILARYASRTVYEESLDNLSGSILWPSNFFSWLGAWTRFMRVELQLGGYESYLKMRALVGMRKVEVGDSFRE